eukprot:876786-Rhodomonas_salina.2
MRWGGLSLSLKEKTIVRLKHRRCKTTRLQAWTRPHSTARAPTPRTRHTQPCIPALTRRCRVTPMDSWSVPDDRLMKIDRSRSTDEDRQITIDRSRSTDHERYTKIDR